MFMHIDSLAMLEIGTCSLTVYVLNGQSDAGCAFNCDGFWVTHIRRGNFCKTLRSGSYYRYGSGTSFRIADQGITFCAHES